MLLRTLAFAFMFLTAVAVAVTVASQVAGYDRHMFDNLSNTIGKVMH